MACVFEIDPFLKDNDKIYYQIENKVRTTSETEGSWHLVPQLEL
jgi:hypothetical protein